MPPGPEPFQSPLEKFDLLLQALGFLLLLLLCGESDHSSALFFFKLENFLKPFSFLSLCAFSVYSLDFLLFEFQYGV